MFVFEFLLYNIIPITHLAMIHHRSFKKEERIGDDHNQDFIVASSDTVSVEQSIQSENSAQSEKYDKGPANENSVRTSKAQLTQISHLEENSMI